MSPQVNTTKVCNPFVIAVLIVLASAVHHSVAFESYESLLHDQRWAKLLSTAAARGKPMTSTTTEEPSQQQNLILLDQYSPGLYKWPQGDRSGLELNSQQTIRKRMSNRTPNRKPRAEGEKLDSMLNILKKMEECMRLTEGLRFRKRSIGLTDGEEDAAEQAQKLGSLDETSGAIGQRLHQLATAKRDGHRAMKTMCQI